jgi:hypothetical protein
MTLEWLEKRREKFDPAAFLNRLKEIAIIRGDRVEFQNADGFEAHELESILSEQMTFDHNVPDLERERISRNAIIKCAASANFNHDFFLKAASEWEKEYLSRARVDYQLFSSLSIEYSDQLQAPELNDCQFRFYSSLPASVDRSVLADRC